MTTISHSETRTDGRSVGELVRDASITARGMLWDPEHDAAAKVRSWSDLVQAAASLWTALPAATTARDEQLDHLTNVTATMQRAIDRTDWPGPGRRDPDMESITHDLTRATALVSRRIPDAARFVEGADAAESPKARILHTLHVTSHAVNLAVQHHQRNLKDVHPRLARTRSHAREVRNTTDLRNRLTSIEANLENLIDLRWPNNLATEPKADATEPVRLDDALTAWRHHAHRSISSTPTIATVLRLADTQRQLAFTTTVLSGAAAHLGITERVPQKRLHPHLINLEAAWGTLYRRLEPFASRIDRPPNELLQAAAELRSAQRELTHDKANLATPEQMATRTDLAAATRRLHQNLNTGANLAYLIVDVIETGYLRVPARAAHQHSMMLRENSPSTALEPRVASDTRSPDVAAITPADLHQNRPVKLPDQVRDALLNSTTQLIQRAVIADAASSAEHAPSTRAHQHTPGQLPPPQWSLDRASTPSPQPIGPAR